MDDSEQFPALLDLAQDIFLVLDEDGGIRYANAATERILGYPTEELVGQDAFEIVHPDDRAETRGTFDRLVASDGAVGRVEHRTLDADGSWMCLESRMEGATKPGLDGYVVSSRDVTDRKRVEAEHEASQSRLREIAEQANDVLWMFSADWSELLFVNPAFETVSGMSTERLRENPTSFLEVIHPDDHSRVLETMARLSEGEEVTVEYRANPDREFRRWVQVEGVPLYEDGEVARLAGYARDVTDRRRRERQLRVMDRLLRHNLRNDMNVVLGHAALARDQGCDAVEESMEIILRTGEQLLATATKERAIVDLLSDPSARSRADLTAVAEDAIAAVHEAHPEATIELVASDQPAVTTIPELQLAVEELLENAVVHGCEGDSTIRVTIGTGADTVDLCICDDGQPIPRNEIELLSDDVDDLFHGTGLGLWLAHLVVDLADGDIAFERDDGGNRVVVTLPRTTDD